MTWENDTNQHFYYLKDHYSNESEPTGPLGGHYLFPDWTEENLKLTLYNLFNEPGANLGQFFNN